MSSNTKVYEEKMKSSVEHLSRELAAVRAGRANPAVLDKVSVDYYGAPTPIQQVASVAVAEARTLTITPWDRTLLRPISKAIVKELDRRRLMLLDRLAAMPGVSFVRPKGAFYIMVSIPGLGTPMQAAEFLLDAGLAIVPWDEEHLRISYANSYENLSIAMDRMEKALRGRF